MANPTEGARADAMRNDPPPVDTQALTAAVTETLGRMLHEELRSMRTTFDRSMAEVHERIDFLHTEMRDRHEHLDKRVNRSRQAEQELRGAQGPMLRGQVAPFPPGMKMPKLKRCDGKSEKAMRQWFRQLSASLRAYQLTEEDSRAVFFASQHFDGTLETWWQGRVEETDDPVSAGFGSIGALAEAAYKQFSGRDMADVARDKLDRVRQTGTVRAYANIIRENLVYLPHRSEGDNIHTFKRGLKPAIAQALALRKPDSLSKAIELALEVEAAQNPTRTAARDTKGSRSDADLNVLDGDSDEAECFSEDGQSDDEDETEEEEGEDKIVANMEARASKAAKEMWRKEGKCLKCGRKGHFSKDCMSKKPAAGDV